MITITDLKLGDRLEVTLNPVTRLDLIKYAGVSGDFNPIHTIDAEAKNAGLPGIIAHGMWTMGNLSKLFTPYYGEGFIKEFKIRFAGMVFLNDVLTLKADLVDEKDMELIFNVTAVNQNNKETVRGTVRFVRYE
ncbi:MaoC/PaaZ C-terminal domain-containing protein [Pallidibacillus thermolactis]|uniref:MaoC/PaaZ C-terminal domain-containing protein n=1 Tax=Pallidibacillus thermolactis TaxID=251051 RepID=UPI0021D8187A|nr:MaoC/PaaZ C-terminal domain-containing protein [Pallidibacillus thermolactis]MCU9602031.1 MaoC/PaaZ C-terminal domain-containing protein [Pallidibacillus thermolactis subsp. kokeshiiformis]